MPNAETLQLIPDTMLVEIQTPDSTLARPTIINIKYPKGIGYPQQSG